MSLMIREPYRSITIKSIKDQVKIIVHGVTLFLPNRLMNN